MIEFDRLLKGLLVSLDFDLPDFGDSVWFIHTAVGDDAVGAFCSWVGGIRRACIPVAQQTRLSNRSRFRGFGECLIGERCFWSGGTVLHARAVSY